MVCVSFYRRPGWPPCLPFAVATLFLILWLSSCQPIAGVQQAQQRPGLIIPRPSTTPTLTTFEVMSGKDCLGRFVAEGPCVVECGTGEIEGYIVEIFMVDPKDGGACEFPANYTRTVACQVARPCDHNRVIMVFGAVAAAILMVFFVTSVACCWWFRCCCYRASVELPVIGISSTSSRNLAPRVAPLNNPNNPLNELDEPNYVVAIRAMAEADAQWIGELENDLRSVAVFEQQRLSLRQNAV